jgi:hypothetical protein
MAAIFADRFLGEQVAMRGGTLLHKVRSGVQYDPYHAVECVKARLLNLLPEG